MQSAVAILPQPDEKETPLWQSGIVNLSSEGVQLYRQLQESKAENEMIHTILSSLHHVIITLNNDGKCISWNRDPKSMFGIEIETMQREHFTRWFAPDPITGVRPNSKFVDQISQVFDSNAVLREDDTRLQLPQSKTLRVTWTIVPLLKRVEDPVFKPKQPSAEDLKPKFVRRGVVIIAEDRSLLDRMYLETRRLHDEITALRMRHSSGSESRAPTPSITQGSEISSLSKMTDMLRTPMEHALELLRQVRSKLVDYKNNYFPFSRFSFVFPFHVQHYRRC